MAQLRITLLTKKCEIDVKNTHVVIPAGMPRVFISNVFPFKYPCPDQLTRRLHIVTVNEDLRILTAEQEKELEKPEDDFIECMRLYAPVAQQEPFLFQE